MWMVGMAVSFSRCKTDITKLVLYQTTHKTVKSKFKVKSVSPLFVKFLSFMDIYMQNDRHCHIQNTRKEVIVALPWPASLIGVQRCSEKLVWHNCEFVHTSSLWAWLPCLLTLYLCDFHLSSAVGVTALSLCYRVSFDAIFGDSIEVSLFCDSWNQPTLLSCNLSQDEWGPPVSCFQMLNSTSAYNQKDEKHQVLV